MYRLLALDLDGTLLRRDGQVDPRDVAAIRELQAAGVIVTIVTGRLHSGAIYAANTCSIDGAVACMEGAHLVELATSRNLSHHPMPLTHVLRDTLRAHGLASFIFEADGIHHDAAGEPYGEYVRTWSPNLRLVEEALDERVWSRDPLAAVAIGEKAAAQAAHAALAQHPALFSVTFEIYSHPGKWAVLVRAAGRNKGIALGELCRAAGLELKDAVAIGDWINDVPMFEVAGRSFAMGSAPDAVRVKATDVLDQDASTGGGVAEAIRRAWG